MNSGSLGGNIGKESGREELEWNPWQNEGGKFSIIITLLSIPFLKIFEVCMNMAIGKTRDLKK